MHSNIVRRIRHLQRWDSGTIRLLGLIELMLALALLIDSVFAAAVGEDASLFSYLAAAVGAFGLFQTLFFYSKTKLSPALGILLIAEMWIISFVIASIPFKIYGLSWVDSFFEGISGYTTTGATIIPHLDSMPDSLLLWRGITQWTGGITVLVSFSFLLPMIGMAGSGLNSNEFAGSDSGNYSLKVTSASLNFLKIYVLLTVTEIICLRLFEVNSFDSVCIAMSNIPTGGLLPRDDSMASYSMGAQAVTLAFMIFGATNFYMMFRALFKGDPALFKNRETRAMLVWFTACSLIVLASFVYNTQITWPEEIADNYVWNSFYAVISAGTGTGFSIINDWGFVYRSAPFIVYVLLIVEFMGGASGSTAGGIKIYRLMALYSYLKSGLNKVLHPNAVTSIRADGKNMNEEAVTSAISTVLLFLVGLLVGVGLVMLFDPHLDSQTVFGTVLAAISNAGIGPFGSYDVLSVETKIVMCFLMWLGRMEMVLIIIMATRAFWSDVRLSVGHIKSLNARSRAHRTKKK